MVAKQLHGGGGVPDVLRRHDVRFPQAPGRVLQQDLRGGPVPDPQAPSPEGCLPHPVPLHSCEFIKISLVPQVDFGDVSLWHVWISYWSCMVFTIYHGTDNFFLFFNIL